MTQAKRERLKGLVGEIYFVLQDENHDTMEGIQDMVSEHIKTLQAKAKSPISRAKLMIAI